MDTTSPNPPINRFSNSQRRLSTITKSSFAPQPTKTFLNSKTHHNFLSFDSNPLSKRNSQANPLQVSISEESGTETPRSETLKVFTLPEDRRNSVLLEKLQRSQRPSVVEHGNDVAAMLLKEEIRQKSIQVLTARANGSMYISELWGRKQYNKVKSESGLGKVIKDTKRLHWVTTEHSTDL